MPIKTVNDKIKDPNDDYKRMAYSRQQMRDTIGGSNDVKRKNEMYLPMPAGFELQDDASAVSRSITDTLSDRKNFFNQDYDLPWWHSNPAYRLYLQRAKFPDITARSLDGLQGIAINKSPSFELGKLNYLEENSTQDGLGLMEFYAYCVAEILAQGKGTIIVDVDESTNEFYMTLKMAESNLDWDYDIDENKKRYLSYSVFVEMVEGDCEYLEYYIDSDGDAAFNRYDKDCKLISEYSVDKNEKLDVIVDPDNKIRRYGTTNNRLPIFNIGSKINDADADHIPLLGISDIALSIYQKDADLSHAEHLTCSPTLFMFGFDEGNRPQVLGGGVGVTNSNPEAHAEYTQTDTSGLQHVKDRIREGFEEAAAYGASIIGSQQNRNEKLETAKLRNSGVVSSLVNICENTGKAIQDALRYMAKWSGNINPENIIFEPNTDFVDHSLDPAELTALLGAWIQNAISHDTLLYNLSKAGKFEEGTTIEDEKARIGEDIENDLLQAAKELANMKKTGESKDNKIETKDDEDEDEEDK